MKNRIEVVPGVVVRSLRNGVAIEIAEPMRNRLESAIEYAARGSKHLAGEDIRLLMEIIGAMSKCGRANHIAIERTNR